ncbi:SDR family NAD(P)-dependent oxidoreductase [Candidatus Gracilibacteria bacterium]|nr:SDR family NAD(P)-dependent oxidoreductase [Candidatus Gracilibacteria bacterium]
MKNILITGHSKGIGKYLNYNLKDNHNVFGFSRENGFDLTQIETFEKIKESIGNKKIDILILNAGVGEFGKFEDNSLEKYENLIILNLLANIRLLKRLEENIDKNTKIIFIGSIISKKFMKNAAVYQASKFGLRGFAGGLKNEGKKIFLLNPSIVDTNFHKNKVDLDKRFKETKIIDILEVIKNIISGNEKRFEIDL